MNGQTLTDSERLPSPRGSERSLHRTSRPVRCGAPPRSGSRSTRITARSAALRPTSCWLERTDVRASFIRPRRSSTSATHTRTGHTVRPTRSGPSGPRHEDSPGPSASEPPIAVPPPGMPDERRRSDDTQRRPKTPTCIATSKPSQRRKPPRHPENARGRGETSPGTPRHRARSSPVRNPGSAAPDLDRPTTCSARTEPTRGATRVPFTARRWSEFELRPSPPSSPCRARAPTPETKRCICRATRLSPLRTPSAIEAVCILPRSLRACRSGSC